MGADVAGTSLILLLAMHQTAAEEVSVPSKAPIVLTVDATQPGTPVSPLLYGIFLEDVNHAVEGGLYAELVRNRSFEEAVPPARCTVKDGKLTSPTGWTAPFPSDDPLPGWALVTEGGAKAAMQPEEDGLLNEVQSRALRVRVQNPGSGRAGVANEGFWGIALRKDAEYRLSFFAKADERFQGKLDVTLTAADGRAYAQAGIGPLSPAWKRYEVVLRSSGTDPKSRLTLTATHSGTFWLDVVSLFPVDTFKGRPNGARRDLAEMLAAMNPAFLRFPGGCIVEGFTKETAIRWKETIGPIEKRPGRWNLWGYRMSDGFGYHESLQLSEDLGAEPLFVINCGMTCQGRIPERVTGEELDEWVQDALDAVEYANGPADSPWGMRRAENGHPEPFNLKYVEIGNENSGPEYELRYARFHEALKKAYPEVQLIADCVIENAPTDIVDEHYYNSPAFFLANANRYDGYARPGTPVYVGEYAVVQECGQGNLRAALAEAAFMTGMERNGDLVRMASYAPLFVNVNDRTWNPDAIVFDGASCYGTPSYHVQRLFAEWRADTVLPTTLEGHPVRGTLSRGGIGLSTWETQAEFRDVRVTEVDQVLYAADFSGGASGWTVKAGDWKTEAGAYRQTAGGQDMRATAGDAAWTNYVLSLKARKLSGAEGFLVMFRVQDEANWLWWNIGGWGNRRHGLEQTVAGHKTPVGDAVPGSVETNRWYDIRVELDGSRVKCLLDGQVIHDTRLLEVPEVAAVAGRRGGNIVIKVVNASDAERDAEIRLKGADTVNPEGEVIVLTAESPDAENSLQAPERVAPIHRQRDGFSKSFHQQLPPNSITVLRIGCR